MKKTNIKLSFFNTRFITNDRTNVCVINCEITIPYKLITFPIEDALRKRFPLTCGSFFRENYVIEFIISGKSKAHPMDSCNNLVGQRIAESRAKLKAYKVAGRVLKTIFNHFYSDCVTLGQTIDQFGGLIDTENKHVKELQDWAQIETEIKEVYDKDSITGVSKALNISKEEAAKGLKFLGFE